MVQLFGEFLFCVTTHSHGSRIGVKTFTARAKTVWRQVYPSRSRRDVLRFATCLKCKKVDVFTFLDQKKRRNNGAFAIHKKKQDEEMQLLADALHPSVPILPPLPAPPGAKDGDVWTKFKWAVNQVGSVKIHS